MLALACSGCVTQSLGLVVQADNARHGREKAAVTSAISTFARARGFEPSGWASSRNTDETDSYRFEFFSSKTIKLASGQEIKIRLAVIDLRDLRQIDVNFSAPFSNAAERVMAQTRRDLRAELSRQFGEGSVTEY
ncbi:MAG: hypothetical protein JSR82_06475 [Verrucomicrobia bacterium]|nr:hypothetical protein [Verrucomicrobiota bacterium]